MKSGYLFVCTCSGSKLRKASRRHMSIDDMTRSMMGSLRPYVELFGVRKYLGSAKEVRFYREHGVTIRYDA